MEKNDKKYLSASRIKTLESCSWIYWCKYHLKLPDKTNSGALRGTICHLVFEMIIGKKRKKYFNKILKVKTLSSVPSIDRLVKKWIKKYELQNEDYCLVEKMIIVGLETDFYGEEMGQAKILDPEYEFKIENKTPSFNIAGFIDKITLYPKEGKLVITDYKTSKEKFKGDEKDCNVQALMYSLVAKNKWPEYKKIIVKFIFLKFPEQPTIEICFSEEEMEGFSHYLEYLNGQADSFTEKTATAWFAADMEDSKLEFKGRKMCGRAHTKGQLKKDGSPMWHCSFKFDFEYYVLLDKENKIIKSYFKEEDIKLPSSEFKIEKRFYGGCPKYALNKKQSLDNFGI